MKLLLEHLEEDMKWFLRARINYNHFLTIFPIYTGYTLIFSSWKADALLPLKKFKLKSSEMARNASKPVNTECKFLIVSTKVCFKNWCVARVRHIKIIYKCSLTKPLKETNLGVAQAFWPLKEIILKHRQIKNTVTFRLQP